MDETGSGAVGLRARARTLAGESLRDCREGFGESLDSISMRTGIQARYLEALEQGNYEVFPGEIWARLFLRGYAQELGLDVDAMLRAVFEPAPLPAPRTGQGVVPRAGMAASGRGRDAGGSRRDRRRLLRGSGRRESERAAAVEPEADEVVPRKRQDRRRSRAPASGTQGDEPDVLVHEVGRFDAPRPGGDGADAAAESGASGEAATGWVWPSPAGDGAGAGDPGAERAGTEAVRVASSLPDPGPIAHRRSESRLTRRGWASPGFAVVGSLVVAGLLTWLVIALVRPGPTRGTLAGKSGTTASRRPGETAQAIPAVRVVTDRGGKATYQVRASTVHMTLIFDGPCWVGMEIPGTPGYVTSRTYEAGQILQLARPAGFTLKVGAGWRAHGVLDGKPVGPWRGGNVWTLTVTQENPIGVGGTTKKAGA